MALTKTYKTRKFQNVYDLAVQLYGNMSNIGELMKLFPNLDDEITLNSEVFLTEQKDPIAKFFLDRGITVATDLVTEAIPPQHTFDTTLFRFDSTLITFDETI